MQKEKILCVQQYEPKYNKEQNIYDEVFAYQYTSKLERKWKHFYLKFKSGNQSFSREFAKVDLRTYSLVVIREIFSWDPLPLIRYIRSQNPTCHILYWLRNTLFAEKYGTGITKRNIYKFLNQQKKYNFQIITYDKGDCERYDLPYVPQALLRSDLYDKNFVEKPYVIKQDVFWYGKDKGRIPKVLEIKRFCDEYQLTYRMHTLRQKKKVYTEEEQSVLAPALPYKQYLEMILKSRATLDILQTGQKGLGARPIETMMLKRKLITDYKGIRDYDFYRKENIFVLGVDDMAELKRFILSPYKALPENVVRKYTFEGMIQHIYQTMGWNWDELS